MPVAAAPIDHHDLRVIAGLIARLTPSQQWVAAAVADGFRAAWLEPAEWERCWRHCDFSKEDVIRDAMTWFARRSRRMLDYPA
jgi:hypothetical protein